MQPTYWARCHVWNRYLSCDCFIWLDHVKFSRSSTKWEDRTVIEGRNGQPITLRLPLRGSTSVPWKDAGLGDRWRKHATTIRHCYGKTAHWPGFRDAIDAVYDEPAMRIEEVCWRSFHQVVSLLGNPVRVLRSSELAPASTKSDLVLELLRRVGASSYLTGEPGASYLDANAFHGAGITIDVQRWRAPSTAAGLTNPSVMHLIAAYGATTTRRMLQ